MKTILVIDASAVISSLLSEMDYAQGYMPQSVADELRCQKSNELMDMHMCKVDIRNPSEKYVKIAAEKSLEMGHTALSAQDIELAALALEVSEENNSIFSSWITADTLEGVQVVAATLDNTLRALINLLGVQLHDTFSDKEKKYLQRCYTCTKVYKTEEKIDFCKSCGYSTVNRVGYTEKDGKIELFLSKNYKYNEKTLHHHGKAIKSQDQKEYRWYRKSQRKEEKKEKKNLGEFLNMQEWSG
ncbi:hypothetical protein NEMIN01_0341 [Nematocida minor]|uniref:uncharacterized protein n=1 Tax=Nematocida minor TaxID=1912983 RepID=UPI00221F1194|nr:uncharacterized protein NEMIN01_0341 [Nematocida minor]KAI5189175.1 hypothetical protein NEMIN01_0341 [Nematocida minor]